MALKYREELVGKRFLAVKNPGKQKNVAEWEWRAGVVRAMSQENAANKDLQVLVEFDGADWQLREWVKIHDIYQVFMVEKALIWARRKDPGDPTQETWWPALNFLPIVDKMNVTTSTLQPIEFFIDSILDFQNESTYSCQDSPPMARLNGQVSSASSRRQADLDKAVRQWLEYQDGQGILLTTPTVLVGYRVKVYRTEGTTQWYTAVIQQYNHATKELTILDDTVLEEHNEDPAVTQIVLLDGVVESILKGTDQRIAPRRRACNSKDKDPTGGCGGSSCSTQPLSGTAGQLTSLTPVRGKAANSLHLCNTIQLDSSGNSSSICPVLPAVTTTLTIPGQEGATSSQLPASASCSLRASSKKLRSLGSGQTASVEPRAQSQSLPAISAKGRANVESCGTLSTVSRKRDSSKLRLEESHLVSTKCSDSEVSTTEDQSRCPHCEGGHCSDHTSSKSRVSKASKKRRPLLSRGLTVADTKACPADCVSRSSVVCLDTDATTQAGHAAATRIPQLQNKNDLRLYTAGGVDIDLGVPLESAVSLIGSDMHYKKLHLLGAGGDLKPPGATGVLTAAALPPAAAAIAEVEKARHFSPAIGSEPSLFSLDKLSDCGSADNGSTSGYSSATTVETMSPHREPTATSRGTECSAPALANAVPSSSPTLAAEDMQHYNVKSSHGQDSRGLAFNAREPVQVYRDPELLKKDEESRRKLVGISHQSTPPAQAIASGLISSPSLTGRRPLPSPQPFAVANVSASVASGHLNMSHQAVAAQQRASTTAAVMPLTSGVPPPSHLVGRGNVAQLLSSSSSSAQQAQAQHLSQLEAAHGLSSLAAQQQLHHLQLFQQQQQELAAFAQLQLLWQQKCPAVPLPTSPWALHAYQDEFFRECYREREFILADREHHKERERHERDKLGAEKGKLAVEREKTAVAVGSVADRERARTDRERHDKELVDCERRAEREHIVTESAATEAVNQHFSESLRLATKKGAGSAGQWQVSGAHHRQPSAGFGSAGCKSSPGDQLVGNLDKNHPDQISLYLQDYSRKQLHQDSDRLREKVHRGTEKLISSPGAGVASGKHTGGNSQSALPMPVVSAEERSQQLAADSHHAQFVRFQAAATVAALSGQHDPPPVGNFTNFTQEQLRKFSEQYALAAMTGCMGSLSLPAASAVAAAANGLANGVLKQEPKFSLYGFQPFHPTYISQDKLHRRLDRPQKEEQANCEYVVDGKATVLKREALTPSPPPAPPRSVERCNEERNAGPGAVSVIHRPSAHRPKDSNAVPVVNAAIAGETSAVGTQGRRSAAHQRSSIVIDGIKKEDSKKKPSSASFVSGAITTASQAHPPAEAAYSYHLIQEGLIPNPIYTQATLVPAGVATSSSISALAAMQPGQGASSCSTKKSNMAHAVVPHCTGSDAKASNADSNVASLSLQSSANDLSVAGSLLCRTQRYGEHFHTGEASADNSLFVHSFKSFVETAVQKAYFQDLEEDQKQQQKQSTVEHSSIAAADATTLPLERGLPPAACATSLPPTLSPNGDSSSSSSSTTGHGDATDSDTLSAPSPPMSMKNAYEENSNDSTSRTTLLSSAHSRHHPKLKKAWLQRHSDEGFSASSPPALWSSQSRHHPLLSRPHMQAFLPPRLSLSVEALPDAVSTASSRLRDADSKAALFKGDSTNSEAETESQVMLKRKTNATQNDSGKKQKTAADNQVPHLPTTGSNKKPKSRKHVLLQQNGSSISSSRGKQPESDTDDSDAVPALERKKRRKELTAIGKEKHEGVQSSLQTAVLGSKLFVKASVAHLKKTGAPFLQDGYCCEMTPRLQKCRECKMTPNQRNKKMPNIFCRFYAFRRLRFSQKGILTTAGFSEPSDAEAEDLQLWLPKGRAGGTKGCLPSALPALDVVTAKYIIANVGDEFCKLVEQEKECRSWANPMDKIMWKRAVQGVRETCDVCDTTLFNMHWVCQKCGFVVCMDCYRVKRNLCSTFEPSALPSAAKTSTEAGQEDESRKWLTCSCGRQPHDPVKLTLTQIIPGDALFKVGELIHDVRKKHGIKARCPCGQNNDPDDGESTGRSACLGSLSAAGDVPKNGVCQQLLNAVSRCYPSSEVEPSKLTNGEMSKDRTSCKSSSALSLDEGNYQTYHAVNGVEADHSSATLLPTQSLGSKGINAYSDDPLSLLADVASMDCSSRDISTANTDRRSKQSSIIAVDNGTTSVDIESDKKGCQTLRKLLLNHPVAATCLKSGGRSVGDAMQAAAETNLTAPLPALFPAPSSPALPTVSYSHYQPRSGTFMKGRSQPVPICRLTETSLLYPDVPHSWLCEGRLLRLHNPRHSRNFTLFNQRWKVGQPVIVSSVTCEMSVRSLWSPETFSHEFGQMEGDLVNCRTGIVLFGQRIKDFWDGFENTESRIMDTDGQPMLLKLKDWPPGEDFSDLLPSRFKDLMAALPMPEYTRRNGHLNLASRLPDFFVKPDLGPKMYNAYGMAKYPQLGTTNLHLDVSDAVNVMVYVAHDKALEPDVLRCIERSDVDAITRQRLASGDEVPGALWHVWDACDADKIRDLLNKVAVERGEHVEPYHDPIHDQSCYLDGALRERLRREYGVHGFAIVQCAGDALFIPAGAPHQVQNLNSCIKVAEDFVSPEHLHHCFKLTQEFRRLSATHSNHEDKLQVKNIIYHAVKDAVAVLSSGNSAAYSAAATLQLGANKVTVT